MSAQLSYKIEVFEGPLDLLLNLISKNKLNIYDIQISELLEQYTSHIRLMKEADLEIASEFLEMAARLVYIKSLSLLPKHEEEEEMKKELTGQLLEYRLCKLIASELSKTVDLDKLVKSEENISIDMKYTRFHNFKELTAHYLAAVGRGKRFLPPPEERFSGIVAHKVVSVSSQIVFVLRKLWRSRETDYEEVFKGKTDASERVAVFLALLELVKSKRISINGEEEEAKITLLAGGRNIDRD